MARTVERRQRGAPGRSTGGGIFPLLRQRQNVALEIGRSPSPNSARTRGPPNKGSSTVGVGCLVTINLCDSRSRTRDGAALGARLGDFRGQETGRRAIRRKGAERSEGKSQVQKSNDQQSIHRARRTWFMAPAHVNPMWRKYFHSATRCGQGWGRMSSAFAEAIESKHFQDLVSCWPGAPRIHRRGWDGRGGGLRHGGGWDRHWGGGHGGCPRTGGDAPSVNRPGADSNFFLA